MAYVDADVPALSTFAGPLRLRRRVAAAEMGEPTTAQKRDIQAVRAAMKLLQEATPGPLPQLEVPRTKPPGSELGAGPSIAAQ
jgi:hypothetical protein